MSLVREFKNKAHFVANHFQAALFGYPIRKLKVIAVTGTDGKTTTSHLISHILTSNGLKVASITTLGATIQGRTIDTGFHVTTPSGTLLQRFLREAVKAKCDYLILEITAHGIDQHRVVGLRPEMSVFTNITNNEHLDYFHTYENYLNTKAKLIPISKISLFNRNSNSAPMLVKVAEECGASFEKYGAESVEFLKGSIWQTSFPGSYNLENAAAAFSAAAIVGIEPEKIKAALSTAVSVSGRYERFTGKGIEVIVDFAHTPEALRSLLSENKTKEGNNIVVFGCAGKRDTTKRKPMGEIAMQLADKVIITSEDPRTEDAASICNQIAKGASKYGKPNHDYFIVPDRKEAIRYALNELAAKGDRIFVTGKGHERSMCIGTTEYPWSDQEEVTALLNQ